jgi:hypothetical protein
LHFLPQVDYIYTIADGRIAERGTYSELMSNNGEFSKFLTEFGSKGEEEDKREEKEDKGVIDEKKDELAERRGNASAGAGLMQAEERNTGAINWGIYKAYSVAGRGSVMLPLLFISLVLMQGTTVMSSYWYVIPSLRVGCLIKSSSYDRLVYWQEKCVFLWEEFYSLY